MVGGSASDLNAVYIGAHSFRVAGNGHFVPFRIQVYRSESGVAGV